METTKTREKIFEQLTSNNLEIRYAYASQELKTWFLTKTKFHSFKGTRLLMVLGCKQSEGPISIFDTYPQVGMVVQDKYGILLEIVTCDWY